MSCSTSRNNSGSARTRANRTSNPAGQAAAARRAGAAFPTGKTFSAWDEKLMIAGCGADWHGGG